MDYLVTFKILISVKKPNNCFNLIFSLSHFVLSLRSLRTKCAKPLRGAKIQVKQMLGRRRFRGAKIINREQK